ncbi:hypothetical protein [Paraburkholderia sp. RL17-337-BIB-A]|uniref:hypothetical protein n=1 Tax=Paraburkholderia sp. RL17-337-BIB-A TaxID=3031636 RepID=UPI0038BD91EE
MSDSNVELQWKCGADLVVRNLGAPLVATGGAVKLEDRLKQVPQTMDTVSLYKPIPKYRAEVVASSSNSEVAANAFGQPSEGAQALRSLACQWT